MKVYKEKEKEEEKHTGEVGAIDNKIKRYINGTSNRTYEFAHSG